MRSQAGLSLLELLIAFVIITIAFLALAMSQVTGLRTTRDALDVSVARDIASRQMEQMRGLGYFYFKDCPSTSASVIACEKSGQTVSGNPGYTLSWKATNQPKNPANTSATLTMLPAPLISVEITVAWRGKTYRLASYLSCADAGELSSTSVACPIGSMR